MSLKQETKDAWMGCFILSVISIPLFYFGIIQIIFKVIIAIPMVVLLMLLGYF